MLMSEEAASQKEANNPEDPGLEEAIERIKNPPAIDDALRELDPQELLGNPAVVPEMLGQMTDLRDDLRRDE
jgi:hypothetical protein